MNVTGCSFFIQGKPRSTQTGSVIRVGGRLFPIRRNTAWSSICGVLARDGAPSKPLEGALRVTLTFYMPCPKKHGEYPTTRPDLENLCKGLLDSWNGVLWKDDSQVVELRLAKCYELDGNAGVHVCVEQVGK